MFHDLISKIKSLNKVNEINSIISQGNNLDIKLNANSSTAFFVSALRELTNKQFFVITQNYDSAERWYNDLKLSMPDENIAFLSKPKKHIKFEAEDDDSHFGWLVDGLRKISEDKKSIAIIDETIFELEIPLPAEISENKKTIYKNQNIDFEDFVKSNILNGFNRKDFVEQEGDIAIRGGIVDIYPLAWTNPLRIEFWGNDIESIREFDVLSQRSIMEHKEATYIANVFHKSNLNKTCSILEYISQNNLIIIDGKNSLSIDIDSIFSTRQTLSISYLGATDYSFTTKSQPPFNSSVKSICLNLREYSLLGYDLFLSADGFNALNRLQDLITNFLENDSSTDSALDDPLVTLNKIHWSDTTPAYGFVSDDFKLVCYTEHQLFERLRAKSTQRNKQKGITLKELKQLNPGDYVVHEDKGVAKFQGFENVKLGDSLQDCAKLMFAGNDILYVHLNYINKIQKYSAGEGHMPILSKLGGTEWLRKKQRTKSKLKDIARDLIKLYAERKMQPGFAFDADNVWQKEFEASFMYEDTPDQASATDEFKRDMESSTPMDRLVCGDVGFGKTEIAIRAAFKAVQSGKQVAVLVPTTILAQQHYMTFMDRLNRYPVNLDVISRFRSKKEQTEILEKLNMGGVDILIGTHRLLSKDINFKNLGLIVIDEEHRFGVSAKEKLRQLKATIDTLTLTATPIPRTLNFSLMGARDLSIIETPPRNRIPVDTQIIEWDNELIKSAILKELARGGQVFFVNDKVQDLEKLMLDLKMILPEIKIAMAHGQMKTSELESVMQKFISGKFEVLLATKIIESGIDIPNANTMLINKAQNFGLAELYQLRGRVGRANKQAYCYLIIPEMKKLPQKALQRLQAIEEFTDLGSGFKLAMKDMEIRGAGNLLGAEQSGFIIDMGFELFHKILDEAVTELKEQEFKDFFSNGLDTSQADFLNNDIAIELNTDALLPETYVKRDTDRFELYKKMYSLKSYSDLELLAQELEDKYGKLPVEAKELLFAVKVRIVAQFTGFSRIIFKPTRIICEFPTQSDENFYNFAFPLIMDFVQDHSGANLRQTPNKLFLEFDIKNREQAIEILWKIKRILEFAETE